jgi:hypothetical protein
MTNHPHLSWFSLYWLAWLIAFLVPELYFVFVNPNNTLSDTVWSLEGVNFAQPFDFAMWTDVHWAIALGVWLLFAWLSLHFPFGLLR